MYLKRRTKEPSPMSELFKQLITPEVTMVLILMVVCVVSVYLLSINHFHIGCRSCSSYMKSMI